MTVVTTLLQFFLILLIPWVIGIFIAGQLLNLILTRYKIKIKDKKKLYSIPFFVYILSIFSQIITNYIHKIFSLIFLIAILYLIYYLIKTFFKLETKKALLISVIWTVLFIISNFVLAFLLLIFVILLKIPLVTS